MCDQPLNHSTGKEAQPTALTYRSFDPLLGQPRKVHGGHPTAGIIKLAPWVAHHRAFQHRSIYREDRPILPLSALPGEQIRMILEKTSLV